MPPGAEDLLEPCRVDHAVAEYVSFSTTPPPILTPMRNRCDRSTGTVLVALAMPPCIAVAHETASTTDANYSSRPSPVVLTICPL